MGQDLPWGIPHVDPRLRNDSAPSLSTTTGPFVSVPAGWYNDGTGVEARIAALAGYLGHVNPASTYWYMSASPELLQIVNERVQERIEGNTP
jgi:hypothetical protein